MEKRTSQTANSSVQDGSSTQSSSLVQPSTISLPKGGGAIRGMGEKFAANPVTGTGAMTVPIATSPGRGGFGPQLALSYDSGAGNGPFGLGWNLSLPTITRKTDKGLPQYRDAEESDVFILSGAEDLVPMHMSNGERFEDKTSFPGYVIHRYRPRIEGLFARIERWTNTSTGEIHWRSITKDNITTLYGKDNNSRIFDPADPDPVHPTRIFSWLICQSYDDKGNAIVYEYQSEDSQRIFEDQQGQFVALAHECNRSEASRSANRYLKRIKYGNRTPNRNVTTWQATDPTQLPGDTWMFEVVFDYGEHSQTTPLPNEGGVWPRRKDPFSTYRAGFEVRTYRLCQRVLMFHHFPGEEGVGKDCLVRSTDFTYGYEVDVQAVANPVYSKLRAVTQIGYKRSNDNYISKALPPLEFTYSEALLQNEVYSVDAASLENLPVGLDGATYQWIDLHGEGIPGILTEQAGAWFYKRNLSPINRQGDNGATHLEARFAPVELVTLKPNLALGNGAQIMDLAGDGQPDLVVLDGPLPGFYEHDLAESWCPFRPFTSRLNRETRDPNLKFVDLDGDGHADVLISEEQAFVWHPSLGEAGFGPAQRVHQVLDEEKGPRLVFADREQAIYLADLSGDGLTDLVRLRNGEVCYWPNLGYGRFGAKVTMDNAPWFDAPDQFNQQRIRLADIDGSGTTDIIYLHRDGVRIYFNQSGNSWSAAQTIPFPLMDNVTTVQALDLLGDGTACLVWSSPLPGPARRPMHYLKLMGEQKPHLLVKTVNNLGAETEVRYAPSTYFYLRDKRDGKPWITRLPFPVHVVERVETHDRISGNRFVTCYTYHHGYFDGEEREFRGFGMVEQIDSEELAALTASGVLANATNLEPASHVPPVLTRTWFHTGAFVDVQHISQQFVYEYYREGDASDQISGLTEAQLRSQSLDDTVLPETLRHADGTLTPYNLRAAEMREACRALKGSILRQEIYARDRRPDGILSAQADRPYSVSERNYTIELLQPQATNPHAVFFVHPREQIDFHYERTLVTVNGAQRADPRVSHAMTLETDAFGNVLRTLAIGYRRRALPGVVEAEQQATHLMLSVNRFANRPEEAEWYRVGLPVEARTYEIVKPPEPTITDTRVDLFRFQPMVEMITTLFPLNQTEPDATKLWPYEKWDWRSNAANAPTETRLRLIEQVRTLYRYNDLTGSLPLGEIDSLALPFESYKLAFTPDLVTQIYQRGVENLLPNPAPLLEGKGVDQGGYSNLDGVWWIPSGKVFYDIAADVINPAATAAQELAEARQHFFLPRKFSDPFAQSSTITYDTHDLTVLETRDPLDNTIRAQTDYRVLQPVRMTDANDNRAEVAFDTLGMVVATALRGKAIEPDGVVRGDLLEEFAADPPLATLRAFVADSHGQAANLLGKATTLILYDLDRFRRCGQPSFAATLARETHFHDSGGAQSKIQINFSYSDGFGREIQKKIRAEGGDAPQRQPVEVLPSGDIRPGALVRDVNGKPVLANTPQRWLGSGRTVYNNKGKPVKQYEPFFSATHLYEEERDLTDTGVSLILFYDPLERVIATLHPNHTYEKVVFDPWQQRTYDSNDTVALDPRSDPDIAGYVSEYFKTQPVTWQSWRDQRSSGQLGAPEQDAATKAVAHANTPTIAYVDSLGRTFLTIADNGLDDAGVGQKYATRVHLDSEGNQREVIDTKDRVVMRYAYDLLGTRIHQASMEAGERWMLNDVTGKPIRAWDSRGFLRRLTYDELRRPTGLFVTENGIARLAERTVYGEGQGLDNNHRTQVYQISDGAGVVTNEAFDFKGNLLRSKRDLLPDYKQAVDWEQNPVANDGAFTTSTSYDALNRPVTITTPDNSIYRPTFNDANLLDKVEVNLRGEQENGQAKWTPFVTNLNYNAKGQRELIAYQNGAQTTYRYDLLTFRLMNLRTTRPAGLNGLASQLFNDPTVVQDLRYTYDPVGNITRIEDAALAVIFHNNEQVRPVCDYTYDAIYRLLAANGREHIGQTAFDFNPPNGNRRDYPFFGAHANPNNPQEVRNYSERYVYDEIGNILHMIHQAANGDWTRDYDYEEASLLQPGKQSNRLTRTHVVGHTESYSYRDAQGTDMHGCMTALNGMAMIWDFEDQLQRVDLGGGGTAYYVYDAGGQRVRKVIERQNGTRREERIYVGGFELYREYNGDGQTITLERETLHIMDDKQRIALVETRAQGSEPSVPAQLVRYQFGNHLGSASLELDRDGGLITYEEYHPYGTTAFQAGRSAAEVSLKHYRHTGKERDEETGFAYHGARYYAPWLGKWTSCDPKGLVDGLNIYSYVRARPTTLHDPTGTQSADEGMSTELRAAWDAAEHSNYDEESVQRLVDAQDRDFERRGVSLWTRQGLLERATVRATTAVRQWHQGNYGTALAQGTAGVIESLGIGYGLFGESRSGTAGRMAFQVATAGLMSRFTRAAGARGTSAPPTGRPSVPEPVPVRAAVTPPRPPSPPTAPPRPTPPAMPPAAPTIRPVVPSGGAAAAARNPIFADTDLLIAASRGHAGALAEIRAGLTYITPNQLREFLNVATSAQRSALRTFLTREGITVFGGPRAGALAQTPEFQAVFQQVAAQQGRGDAALAAFARATGYQAVTMERRLFNFLTQTLPRLGVPIRRVPR